MYEHVVSVNILKWTEMQLRIIIHMQRPWCDPDHSQLLLFKKSIHTEYITELEIRT